MAARTGAQFLERLRRHAPNLYVDGARVEDPTTHPATRNIAASLAGLYDLQHDPRWRDLLTFEEGGERYAAAFMAPQTKADLRRIGEAHRVRANYSLGTLGRAPDYMNTNVMAAGMASVYFAQGEAGGEPGSGRDFAGNMRRYFEYVRDHDLCLTHALTNPQEMNKALSF